MNFAIILIPMIWTSAFTWAAAIQILRNRLEPVLLRIGVLVITSIATAFNVMAIRTLHILS